MRLSVSRPCSCQPPCTSQSSPPCFSLSLSVFFFPSPPDLRLCLQSLFFNLLCRCWLTIDTDKWIQAFFFNLVGRSSCRIPPKSRAAAYYIIYHLFYSKHIIRFLYLEIIGPVYSSELLGQTTPLLVWWPHALCPRHQNNHVITGLSAINKHLYESDIRWQAVHVTQISAGLSQDAELFTHGKDVCKTATSLHPNKTWQLSVWLP